MPAVEDHGSRAARGCGDRLQRHHHPDRHRPPVLLHHRPLRQVWEDRGPQHGGVHPVHLNCEHSPAEHHGARHLHPQQDFLPQGCAGGAPGCPAGSLHLPRPAEERIQDPPPQWDSPVDPRPRATWSVLLLLFFFLFFLKNIFGKKTKRKKSPFFHEVFQFQMHFIF